MRKLFALSCVLAALSVPAWGQPSSTSHVAFNHPLPTVPGKSILASVVEYPPGGHTPPHHHAPSAFITAYVLEGEVRSQVDDGPIKIYHAGESFTENPGSHHVISENASKTRPAKLLAIFVLDTGQTPLTTLDSKQLP